MVAADLKYFTIRDFSPGIFSRSNNHDWPVAGTGQSSALQMDDVGIADATNTYGCYGPPWGGLSPLPEVVATYSAPDVGNSLPGGATDPYIVGAILQGPMSPGSWPESGVGGVLGSESLGYPALDPREPYGGAFRTTHPVDLHIGVEWFRTDTGRREFRWRRYKPYEAVGGVLPAGVDLYTSTSPVAPNTGKISGFYLTRHRMNGWASPPTASGHPVIVGAYARVANENPGLPTTRVFPDPTVLTSLDADLTREIRTAGGMVVSHQGRVVGVERYMRAQGAGFDALYDGNTVFWTEVNDDAVDEFFQVFTYDRHSPIGLIESVSSTDLLLLYHDGGAALIQGDLNNPIVRRLPGVVGTGGIECIPAMTSLGLVYGRNKGGVYAWQGGDESINLSPQMADDFWIDKDYDLKMLDLMGGFCQWGDWIITPNGWWYYVPTKAWWNIEYRVPAALRYFWPMVIPKTNDLMVVTNQASSTFAKVYSQLKNRTIYQWRSQPIKRTIGRDISVREVIITYGGTGQVSEYVFEVTIIGARNNEAQTSQSQSVTVDTFADNSPRQVRIPMSYDGSAIAVQVEVSPTLASPDVPAPSIYDITIGYTEGVSVPGS